MKNILADRPLGPSDTQEVFRVQKEFGSCRLCAVHQVQHVTIDFMHVAVNIDSYLD